MEYNSKERALNKQLPRGKTKSSGKEFRANTIYVNKGTPPYAEEKELV
jgi:hypothetical protein